MEDHFSPFADLPALLKKDEDKKKPISDSTTITGKRKPEEAIDASAAATASPSKVKREGDKGEGEGKEEAASTAKPAVQLEGALKKIMTALPTKKFVKAANLLVKLMAELNQENASLFHSAIGFFMSQDGSFEKLMGSVEERNVSTALFAKVKEAIWLFTPEEQYRAASWILVGIHRQELLTDDTFQFVKAARQVKEYIACLTNTLENETSADKERRRAILACLQTALRQNIFAWAKGGVEELFAAAAEKRVFFPEEEREELDGMATKLRTRERMGALNQTGTLVTRSVRMVNSTASPWTTKATDIYR